MKKTQPFVKEDGFVIAYEQDASIFRDVYTFDFSPSIEEPVHSWRYAYVKRVFDIVCAAIMLVLFAVPGLLIAAMIKLTSQGSVFYREVRVGRGGRPFKIWKFRSMCMHAEHSGHITTHIRGAKRCTAECASTSLILGLPRLGGSCASGAWMSCLNC